MTRSWKLSKAKAIEGNSMVDDFAALLAGDDIDPFEALWGASVPSSASPAPASTAALAAPTAELTSLFNDSYIYLRDAPALAGATVAARTC